MRKTNDQNDQKHLLQQAFSNLSLKDKVRAVRVVKRYEMSTFVVQNVLYVTSAAANVRRRF